MFELGEVVFGDTVELRARYLDLWPYRFIFCLELLLQRLDLEFEIGDHSRLVLDLGSGLGTSSWTLLALGIGAGDVRSYRVLL